MGYREYEPMSARFKVPIVITGFEPLDILQGTLMVARQLEEGRAEVENEYSRILDRDGNRPAQKLVASVFEIAEGACAAYYAYGRHLEKAKPEREALVSLGGAA